MLHPERFFLVVRKVYIARWTLSKLFLLILQVLTRANGFEECGTAMGCGPALPSASPRSSAPLRAPRETPRRAPLPEVRALPETARVVVEALWASWPQPQAAAVPAAPAVRWPPPQGPLQGPVEPGVLARRSTKTDSRPPGKGAWTPRPGAASSCGRGATRSRAGEGRSSRGPA